MSLLKNLFGKKDQNPREASTQLAPGQHAPGLAGAVSKLFDKNEKEVAKIQPIVAKIAALGPDLKALSDDELKAKSAELKARFQSLVTERLGKIKDPHSGEPYGWQELSTQLDWSDDYVKQRLAIENQVLDELLPEAFALVREAGDRTIGLRHFDVQMIGGAVLHSGRIAEMRTGEGKTLVATLPAYLNALTGRGVHVITVNDYLAERDANWMRPIYEFLGLSVSFLANDMETEQRQRAYACDVLYATNSEVGFDYLRDNMARSAEETVQRPLNFAVVDEVDNILIDEARTPLIISAQVAKSERAFRRQKLARVCDGVARKLMPAVTDHEIEALQDSLTARGKINLEGLMSDIEKRGVFSEAIAYLVDAYLLSEQSARNENGARLLDVADEYSQIGLINDEGRTHLEKMALSAIAPTHLQEAWSRETARLIEPFADAYAQAAATNFEARALADGLLLGDEAAADLSTQMEASEENRAATAAQLVAQEMARRNLVDESATANIAAQLQQHEANGSLDELRSRVLEAALHAPGALSDADALLAEAAADSERASTIEGARHIVGTLEEISQRALLPFEAQENLWEAVQLPQDADELQKEIARTVAKHPGESAQKLAQLASEYSEARAAFLKTESETLKNKLAGFDAVAKLANKGESTDAVRAALRTELAKNGAFAEAIKAARMFTSEQRRVHQQVAAHLVQEMSEWVEVPRDAARVLSELMDEGGSPEAMRDRVLSVVRDLEGENTELPALISEAIRQLQSWRIENAAALVAHIGEKTALTPETSGAITRAIEAGEYSAGFEDFVGEQLLQTPAFAEKAAAIDEFGRAFAAFREKQNGKMLGDVRNSVELSHDAEESLAELLEHPQADMKSALFNLLADDAVSRHLEALLTQENAQAFVEEVQRRVPLAKEVARRMKATDYVGRSAEQLERAIARLVQRTFEVMPMEDFKRVIRNLGWATEKDEKRRQSAATDMGTLIAEREASAPAFTDPENFLETLIGAEILTEEEALLVRRGQAETPDETLTFVIDRVLRLPAERRRRLAESKLQEVQPILDQAIKAHALFKREVNYVVDNGKEIVIVDEFTGRKMPGRRYSEGLHEALEAKHGLEVQLESQTVATITIQNYFRLYNKLGGMTGTAKTEEAEFAKTYAIEVVSIPTNKPIQRRDYPDVVYKTNEAKVRAITFDILEHHCAGQPVLVGTRSVEISEKMSERLKAQPLQTLVLTQLIKLKLWNDKSLNNEERGQAIAALQAPIMQMNPKQVKSIAQSFGVNPDPMADENLDIILGTFEIGTPDRERLRTALRVGLAHNVLNAKNHRNEARIVAEAARPNAVTIATNMAGRGVDIVLGGTLDGESRWRVITMQILARQLEGKGVHVRSRNEETTSKLLDRLSPERLQDLAWLTAVRRELDALEENKSIEGQVAKELRDTIAQEITTNELRTKVKSRARRLGIAEKLPLENEVTESRVLSAFADELQRLMNRSYDQNALSQALQNGVAARSSGRDEGEGALLEVLSHPLLMAKEANGNLLRVLSELESLDSILLNHVAQSGQTDALEIAQSVGNITPEYIDERLQHFGVTDATSAQNAAAQLDSENIEINEAQVLSSLQVNMGLQWLRERFGEWQIVSDARAYDLPDEIAQMFGDSALVHSTLNKAKVNELLAQWEAGGEGQRALTTVEAPNMVLLGEMAEIVGPDAPFLDPQWMHDTLTNLGIIGEGDVAQAQMMAQAQDEEGNIQPMPIDVLVYRLRAATVLSALAPDIAQIRQKVGDDATKIFDALTSRNPWVRAFADEAWLRDQLAQMPPLDESLSTQASPSGQEPTHQGVEIETGVSGQSADIVLESEPRPEDIAHTSEGDYVKEIGGLHIIGSERHESRRIDNQLRGRAGRQGDPGSSRFYISLDDELWRLFGVRNHALMGKWEEDEAVTAGIITKSIERAQQKVELNHFEGRKNVLQYDDVMNVQREVIYRERRRALMGGDLRETVLDMAQRAALAEAEKHAPRGVRSEEWDTSKLFGALSRLFGASTLGRHIKAADLEDVRWVPWHEPTSEAERHDYEIALHDGRRLREIVETLYAEREEQMGSEQLRGLERWQVTRTIDDYWMEHLAEMDYLRDAIWQQGYAQKEPIGVYRQEGHAMFQKMLGEIRREVTEGIFGYEAPQFHMEDELYGGPQIGAMHEARPMLPLPMSEEEMALVEGEYSQDDEYSEDAPRR